MKPPQLQLPSACHPPGRGVHSAAACAGAASVCLLPPAMTRCPHLNRNGHRLGLDTCRLPRFFLPVHGSQLVQVSCQSDYLLRASARCPPFNRPGLPRPTYGLGTRCPPCTTGIEAGHKCRSRLCLSVVPPLSQRVLQTCRGRFPAGRSVLSQCTVPSFATGLQLVCLNCLRPQDTVSPAHYEQVATPKHIRPGSVS
jgi:hypothetical protein